MKSLLSMLKAQAILTMPWLIETTLHKISKKVGSDVYQELIPDMDYLQV